MKTQNGEKEVQKDVVVHRSIKGEQREREIKDERMNDLSQLAET